MFSGNDDYQATLNKMTDLQDLVSTVENTSKTLTANKQKLMAIISDCNKQVQALQGNIDKIKGQGAQAKSQVKELIKSANDRQESTLTKLKATINDMSNTDALESQLGLLKKDIDNIAGAIDTAGAGVGNPAAEAAASKANTSKPATYVPPPMRGGYTYGKRIKGSRRRRGKKSRKKGKAKK
jgi:predicted  nucleic acid-binding Zn-ribbon protein